MPKGIKIMEVMPRVMRSTERSEKKKVRGHARVSMMRCPVTYRACLMTGSAFTSVMQQFYLLSSQRRVGSEYKG